MFFFFTSDAPRMWNELPDEIFSLLMPPSRRIVTSSSNYKHISHNLADQSFLDIVTVICSYLLVFTFIPIIHFSVEIKHY